MRIIYTCATVVVSWLYSQYQYGSVREFPYTEGFNFSRERAARNLLLSRGIGNKETVACTSISTVLYMY